MTIRPLLTLLLLAASCAAQDAARMDQIATSFVTAKKFMGTVLVAQADRVIFSKGYGSANLEWGIPNSPATKFRLGSVTKQFTAASILLLEERGKLAVTDPVKKYMPDAPAAWDQITIFHLLTHTSGIPNFTNFPDYPAMEPFAAAPGKLIARFRDKPLDFPVGEKFSYSNSGYIVLGSLIEKASGESYEQFLRKNIFTPLQMNDSGYDSNSAILPHRASGYSPGPEGAPVNAGFVHMSIPFSAGALYSTTLDLLRWQQGLFGGKVLSPASLQKMTAPFKDNYAFGLVVHSKGGRKVIEHNGGIEGFNTVLAYYPDDKITVVALANLNGQAAGSLAAELGDLALGKEVPLPGERKEIVVSQEILSRYVGTYQLTPAVKILITLTGGKLACQLTGQPRAALFAESETRFFMKVVDAQMQFVQNPAAVVTGLTLFQNGREMAAPRISVIAEPAPERQTITVAPDLLTTYVGTYELRPGFDLVITLQADHLNAQATGQPAFPLFAESENKFFLKVVEAQVEFFKDASGAVSSLMLHQNGADVKGVRR